MSAIVVTAPSAVPIPPENRPKRDGSRFECPAPEGTILSTEATLALTPGAFKRVLDSFVFLVKGKPASIPAELFASQNWREVQVIGAVASLVGKDNKLAQCGWFNHITWRWMHIPMITRICVTSGDRLYRAGATCMVMTTPRGIYTVFSPHKRFAPLWNLSMGHFGSDAAKFRFERCSHESSPPDWWDERALDEWPPTSGVQVKRPPPTDVQQLEALTISDAGDGEDTAVASRRVRRRESPVEDALVCVKERPNSLTIMNLWDVEREQYSDTKARSLRPNPRKARAQST